MDSYHELTAASNTTNDCSYEAAIEWLARIDPVTNNYYFVRALHRHRSGSHGLCVLHSERWPCTIVRLAEAARDLAEARLPRIPPEPPRLPRPRKAT